MTKIEELQELIDQSQKIVFFGGAGVSTESGIPDFRSADGLFNEDLGLTLSAEELVSRPFFDRDPQMFFDYFFTHLVYPDVQPNIIHHYLADLEKAGKDLVIVTQNVDGLHQKAGSQRVYELHGNSDAYYCMDCQRYYCYEDLSLDEAGIPRCEDDGAIVKPDVVLYGENLDPQQLDQSIRAIEAADLLIVGGTSLVVYPAAGLINYYRGDKIVVINKTPLNISKANVLAFEDNLKNVFEQLH